MRLMWNLKAFVITIWIGSGVLLAQTELPEKKQLTPREYLQQRLAALRRHTVPFNDTEVPPNIRRIHEDLSRVTPKVFPRDREPRFCVSLDKWSRRDRGVNLPLYWNGKSFEVLKEQLEYSSDSMVFFTDRFLKAYDGLSAELRDTRSTLALGVATLVALEQVQRTGWNVIPDELISPAAVINILALYRPEIVAQCYSQGDTRIEQLVVEAVREMCAVEGGKTAVRELHQDPTWIYARPYDSAFAHGPIRLADFCPPHAYSLEQLIRKIRDPDTGINNLTLRAEVIVATAPDRFGIPLFRVAARNEWLAELDKLAADVIKDVRKRSKSGSPVAVAPQKPRCVIWDPAVIRPLMMMAVQIDAHLLPDPHKVDSVGYLNALKEAPTTSKVLLLAGADPIVKLNPPPSDPKRVVMRKGTIIFSHIVRVHGENPHSSATRPIPEESVVAELYDYSAVGEGKPIRGVDAFVMVPCQVWDDQTKRWEFQLRRANEIEEGMRVTGYTQVGHPHSPVDVKLDGRQKQKWFTVITKTEHEIPVCSAYGVVEAVDDNRTTVREIRTALDHAVFIKQGTAKGIWRPGWHLDPTVTRLWSGKTSGRVTYIRQLQDSHTTIEFSLSSEKRSIVSNNYEIAPLDGDDKIRMLVEARPITCGCLDSNAVMLLADGSSIPISKLVPNADVKHPKAQASVIRGYYPKPEGDPFAANSPLTAHPTSTVKLTFQPIPFAYELEFGDDDGRTVRVGPGNWLLRYTEGRLEEVAIDDDLKPGVEVVSGIDSEGAPKLISLVRIERVKPDHDFVLIEAVNLSWARVNGVLLSIDYRAWDEGTGGLRGGSQLAQAEETNPVAIASSFHQLPRSVNKSGRIPELKGESLALWDAGLGQLAIGEIGKVASQYSTRTVEVTVKRANETRTLECGPAQALLIQRKVPTTATMFRRASELLPTDQVFLASEIGDTVARPWRVQNVVPLFHPGVPVHRVVSPYRQLLGESSTLHVDVGIANGFELGYKYENGKT